MINLRDVVMSSGGIQIGSRAPDVTGAEIAGVGVDLVQGIQQEKDTRDASAFAIKADADLQIYGQQAINEARNEARSTEDISGLFFEKFGRRYEEMYSQAPNQIAKTNFEKTYQQLRGRFGTAAMGAQVSDTQDFRLGQITEMSEDVNTRIANGEISYEYGKQIINDGLNKADTLLSVPQLQKLKRQQKQNTAKIDFYSKTKQERYAITRGATPNHPGGFAASMEIVKENEGGFVELDGASGHPAIFGVNRKWHKEDHDRIVAITKQKGQEAGLKAAQEFYKKEYWDKNNIASYPRNVQAILIDGVINHSVKFRDKLLNAAKEGKGPAELIDMREQEYIRLGKTEKHAPDLPGWMNRIDKLKAATLGASGSSFDDMSVADKVAAYNEADKYELELKKYRKEDFGQYADAMGMSIDERVAAQPDPFYAKVMSQETAAQAVANMSKLQNVDDVMQAHAEIKQRYGKYTDNAIRDMSEQGLTPHMESALNMAATDPVKYQEYINMLVRVDEEEEKKISQDFADRLLKKVDLLDKFNSEFDELEMMMRQEGKGDDYIRGMRTVYSDVARKYMVDNQTDSYSDAVEFALKPIAEMHNIVDILGDTVRVPLESKSGVTYDRQVIEERGNIAVQDMVFDAQKQFAMGKQEFNGQYVATLNDTETGIVLKDLLGNPMFRENGEKYEIMFDELVGPQLFESRMDQIRRKLSAMPYAERERARKEMFGLSDEEFDPHRRGE